MSLVNKLFSSGFACWFVLSQTLLGISTAYAQSGIIDVEPPLIEHNIVGAADAAARQSFFATVVDDDELDSVTLYYRFKNEQTYSTAVMNRVSYSSTYIAHVPTSTTSGLDIEYYIQARDKAGNRTVRGYAFNPLLRVINSIEVAPVEPVVTTEPVATESGNGKGRTILFVVLGVLTLGLLGSTLVNADSNDDAPSTCGDDGLCTISISVVQPQ